MSDLPKQSMETVAPKEEDWEYVSGSKSLSLEPKDTIENKENDDVANKENKNEIPDLEDTVQANGIKNEEDEEEDNWYHTIPATPMNTPEYTPVPPTYPSSNRGSDRTDELATIDEEATADQTTVFPEEKTAPPEESQSTGSIILQQSLEVIRFTITRVIVFFVGLGLLRWLFSKAREHLNNLKKPKQQTKKAVE